MVTYLLCGARIFQQAMRNTLSNVIVHMAAEIAISPAEKGSLLAAVPLGYFLTQVPGGALADRIGAKNVLTWAMLLSACCCLVLPSAFDAFGTSGLFAVLVTMGAVQGPLFPTSSVLLARWMPRARDGEADEKAWATSMLDVGISVGTLLIIPVVTFLAEAVGWRHTYHTIGVASVAYVVVWATLGAASPEECSYIRTDERAFLAHAVSPGPKKANNKSNKSFGADADADGGATASAPLFERIVGMPAAVALHPGVWAVFIAHMAFNFGAYYLTNWSSTYYKDVLGVPPSRAYIHLMLPHVSNLAVKALNPLIAAWLAARGFNLLSSRRLFTCMGFFLSAAVLLPVYHVRSHVWASTALFSLANACFGLAPSGFKANYLDITEQYVGVISGYGNTLGTIASFGQPKLIARLLDATGATEQSTAGGSWLLVLGAVALINLLAAINYALYSTVTPVEGAAEQQGGTPLRKKFDSAASGRTRSQAKATAQSAAPYPISESGKVKAA
jgi:MFS family permease